jgi:hypothetical protein
MVQLLRQPRLLHVGVDHDDVAAGQPGLIGRQNNVVPLEKKLK